MKEQEQLNEILVSGRKRIGVFGGSFDPVHEGHIYFASLAREVVGLDEVWFLPCQVSPHKLGSPPSPVKDRLAALRLAIRDLKWARIDQTEVEIEGPSYSYQTLETLHVKFPEHQWFWIMGGDQWVNLTQWMHPEKLAELVSFIVMARNGEVVYPRPGYRMQVVAGEHPASSTSIREALARNELEIPYLNPEVARMLMDRSES
jgi:nicotinate-nucleotide adenylyltransferase